MVNSLKNNADLLNLAASKVDTKSILNDASLSADEKLEKLNKLILTMAVEMDDLKTMVQQGKVKKRRVNREREIEAMC